MRAVLLLLLLARRLGRADDNATRLLDALLARPCAHGRLPRWATACCNRGLELFPRALPEPRLRCLEDDCSAALPECPAARAALGARGWAAMRWVLLSFDHDRPRIAARRRALERLLGVRIEPVPGVRPPPGAGAGGARRALRGGRGLRPGEVRRRRRRRSAGAGRGR